MSEIGVVQTVERAKEHGYPAMALSTGGVEAGETAWMIAAQRLTPANLRELGARFDQIEASADRVRREEEAREAMRHAEAVARGEEALTEAEQVEVNQQRIEALADHQRNEAERPQRIEGLLERICNALEGRAR